METSGRSQMDFAQSLIATCGLFRGLERRGLEQLRSRVRLRRLEAGATVFLMGDPGGHVLGVVEGRVQISVPSQDGKEIILAIMEPGDVFGEIGLLDGKERSADAKTMTSCLLAVLDRRDVLTVLDDHPRAYFDIVMLLCERLRRTTTQMADVALLDLPTRLAKALLRVAAAHPGTSASGRVKLSQRELGNVVGATRESVNKCLRSWHQAGIVQIEPDGIRIVAPKALEALTEPGDK